MKRILTLLLCFVSIVPIIMADEKEDSLNFYAQQFYIASQSGDLENGCKYCEHILRIYKGMNEDISQDTVYAYIGSLYANLCYQIGEYKKAINTGKELLNIYHIYGENDPHYITTLSLLRDCCYLSGEKEQACEYNKTSLRIYRENHKDVSQDTVFAEMELEFANMCYEFGYYKPAIEATSHALEIYKSVTHPDYAHTLQNLALFYDKDGQYKKAIQLGHEALSATEKRYGSTHINFIISLDHLACYYGDDQNHKKAINICSKALDLARKTIGLRNLTCASLLDHLAGFCADNNEYQKAVDICNEAIAIYKELEIRDISYAVTLHNIALYHSKLHNYEEAISFCSEALEIAKNTGMINHPDYVCFLSDLANFYSNINAYDIAIRLNSEALTIYEKSLGTNNHSYAGILKCQASNFSALGYYDEAIQLNRKALDIFKNLYDNKHPLCAATLSNLASNYDCLCQYEKAIRLGNEALSIFKNAKGEDKSNYVTTLNNLALYNNHKGNHETAIRLSNEAMSFIKKEWGSTTNIDYATSLNNLAMCYAEFDNNKAIQFATNALDIVKSICGTNNHKYATSLGNLAKFYTAAGNYQKAIKLNKEALEVEKMLGEDNIEYAVSLCNLADDYSMYGDYRQALTLAHDANTIFLRKLGKRHSYYAHSLNSIASCYLGIGEYEKALLLGIEATDIYRESLGEMNIDYASSLNDLANLYFELSNFDEAIRLTTKAIEIQKQLLGEKSLAYATSLGNLALYYSNIKKYDESIPLITKAMEIRKEIAGTDNFQYSCFLSTLMSIYFERGNIDEAIRLATESLQIRKKILGTENPSYATSLNNLAFCQSMNGAFDKSVQLNNEALNIRKKMFGVNHPIYAESLSNLAVDYTFLGQKENAVESIKEFIPIVRKHITNTFVGLTSNERFAFWSQHNIVLNSTLPTILILSDTPEAATILYDNTALFSKGLLLSSEQEMIKLIQESGDAEAVQMYSELRQNRQLLNSQYSKPIAERDIDCDSLENISSYLERQLVSRVKEFGDYTRYLNITWKDVQSKLGDSDIAIEYLSYPKNDSTIAYVALTLCKNDTAPVLTPLFTNLQLMDVAGNGDTYQNAAADELIWGPLAYRLEGKSHVYFSAASMLHNIGIEYLPSVKGKDCYRLSSTRELVTHMPSLTLGSSTTATLYGYIDYNATYASIDSIAFNSDKDYALYSSSPQIINHISEQSNEHPQAEKNSSIAAIDENHLLVTIDPFSLLDNDILHPGLNQNRGGFDYRSLRYEVDSLPGSRVEIQTISALLDSLHVAYVPLMTYQASEESFKALSGQRKSLIHISTHGFYYDEEEAENMSEHMRIKLMGDDRPTHVEDKALLRCGLCFAGANQTFKGESQPANGQADGILNALEIAQTDLRGLDLVVLSACQTALGDVVNGEGVFGLQRGFKKAGAQSILMSLWKVDDKVTSKFMIEFYRQWTSGKTKIESLKKAQSVIKQEYPDPHDWAAFILLDAID